MVESSQTKPALQRERPHEKVNGQNTTGNEGKQAEDGIQLYTLLLL